MNKETADKIREKYWDLTNYNNYNEPIDPLTWKQHDGDSLLHIAVIREDMDTIRILVENGADVNAIGDMGLTPLHAAAKRKNNNEIYNYLVSKGASEDIVNEFGKTPSEIKNKI